MMRERITQLFQNRGRSCAEMAKAVGVSQSSVYKWMRGYTTPSLESLDKISLFFDVPLDWLLGKEER